MEYGIQRRSIYLLPPTDDDLLWFCALFDVEEVWDIFGFDAPCSLKMMRLFREGDIVVGILHRVEDRQRIGFIVMFPPDEKRDYWEFGYAIPDPSHRDAFSAMSSTDAMAHYMFDHLRVDAMGWRTRADNRAADAVIRRLGYTPTETFDVKGKPYTFYRLDRPGWERRRAKLEQGERTHPSGLGAVFLTLEGPPFEPRALAALDAAAGGGAAPPNRPAAADTTAHATTKATAKATAPRGAERPATKKPATKKTATKKTATKKTATKKTATKKTATKRPGAKATGRGAGPRR
jgi:RimJ/RimL family protein N-acetyltransferase